MQLINMFYDQIEDAVARKVPFIIPIGTLEYHAHHASCGTDTMVVTGCLRELEKEKEHCHNEVCEIDATVTLGHHHHHHH